MSTPLLIALIAGSFCFVGLLAALVRRYPGAGFACVGAFVLVAWEYPDTPALVSLAGVQVKPEDGLCAVLATATILSSRSLFQAVGKRWLLITLVCVAVGLSIVSGLAVWGGAAYNDARGTVWLFVAVAWTLTLGPRKRAASIDSAIRWIGFGLILVFIWNAMRYGLGTADSFVMTGETTSQTGRPLVSGQAAFLALAGLWVLMRHSVPRWGGMLTGFLFLMVAIAAMHRSVWVACALGMVVWLLTLRGIPLARTVVLSFYLLVGALLAWNSGVLDPVTASVRHALESDGTLNARSDAWTTLVAESIEKGPVVVLFGSPFGSGWERVIDGVLYSFNPHNWYVVLYLRLGIVGLALIVVLIAVAGRSLILARRSEALAVLIALLTYAWFYHLPWYLGLLLGATMLRVSAAQTPLPDRPAVTSAGVFVGSHHQLT